MDAPDLFDGTRQVTPEVTYEVTTQHTVYSVRAALQRAAFHLRRDGNGAYDNAMAEVLESLKLKEKPK